MKLTKQIKSPTKKELKKFVETCDQNSNWVRIDYSIIPKELFDKYGLKPFEIMKRKMRNDKGGVWKEINYFDAQKEAKKLGYRLPSLNEMLMLLEYYKQTNETVSSHDKEFLGIEELSYDENVHYEWVYFIDNIGFIRGGYWYNGAGAGLFALYLNRAPSYTSTTVGFRCVREV